MVMTRIAVCLAIFLSGCSSTANYENLLESWVGLHADALVASWGPPDNSYSFSDGSRMLEYNFEEEDGSEVRAALLSARVNDDHAGNVQEAAGAANNAQPENATASAQPAVPVQNAQIVCVTRFIVNARGIIKRWTWQGEECKI